MLKDDRGLLEALKYSGDMPSKYNILSSNFFILSTSEISVFPIDKKRRHNVCLSHIIHLSNDDCDTIIEQ